MWLRLDVQITADESALKLKVLMDAKGIQVYVNRRRIVLVLCIRLIELLSPLNIIS